MKFDGIKKMPIASLGLSQIYLNMEKVRAVEGWFPPEDLDQFDPLPVHDFGNGVYTLTDGHTRAYVAYKNGIALLPVIYDDDEMVTGALGQALYKENIVWCQRFGITEVADLEKRILSSDDYQRLWIARCDRSCRLLTKTSPQERKQLETFAPGLHLYGADEDLSELYFESEIGRLYSYQAASCMLVEENTGLEGVTE